MKILFLFCFFLLIKFKHPVEGKPLKSLQAPKVIIFDAEFLSARACDVTLSPVKKMILIHRFLIVLSLTALFQAGCGSSKKQAFSTTLAAADLQPFGRSGMAGGNLELISSAVHFGFRFEGDQCEVYVSLPGNQNHNYLQYELDGQYAKRVRIEGNAVKAITINAPQKGLHKVWIYKATEAHTGGILIHKISGEKLQVLPNPSLPLIEFIGNSITCGAAADASEVPCGAGDYHDQHNVYYAYGPRVARALHANYLVSSVSGIGIYRNWNSDGPSMPQVYEKPDFQESTKENWDFKKYTPQVVSIALGTNDFSRGDGTRPRAAFDSVVFVNNYIQFVKKVQAYYPVAQVVLLNSPVVKGADGIQLQNCLTAVKTEVDKLHTGKTVQVFFFKPMEARGCTGHPSVEDHEIMAKELEPFMKRMLEENNK